MSTDPRAHLIGAAQRTRDAFADSDPPLTNHLAMGLELIFFAFATDADLERARANGLADAIETHARSELKRSARVHLISEEEVDRQGGPMSFFRGV